LSDSWDEYADEWDSDKDAILYSEHAFNSLSSVVKLNKLNILDFGCGTGLLTEKMSPLANKIIALDSSHKMISVLKDKKISNVEAIDGVLSLSSIKENKSLNIKFDLIVASSVCGFLPEYDSTLLLLKSLLVPNGIFVQWDWLSPENNPDFGLSEESVNKAFKEVGFILISLSQPFSITNAKGIMPVLMGVAKNA
jgi:2-polyprenyl-3-methyl-5-hydroxy-6-metoxy-1,4-benzoquinol methylase